MLTFLYVVLAHYAILLYLLLYIRNVNVIYFKYHRMYKNFDGIHYFNELRYAKFVKY